MFSPDHNQLNGGVFLSQIMVFGDKVILVISPHTLFALFQIMETNFAATVKLKPGAKNFGRIAKGGNNFGRLAKAGRKISDLIYFYLILKLNVFWCFYGFWGIFNFLVKGGRKFSDASRRGGEKFQTRR